MCVGSKDSAWKLEAPDMTYLLSTYSFLPTKQRHLLEFLTTKYENEVQVILFEIDCAIFYTNIHELFSQFISWTNWVNSGKFIDNYWISCQVVDDMKKVYNDLIIINLYRGITHICFKQWFNHCGCTPRGVGGVKRPDILWEIQKYSLPEQYEHSSKTIHILRMLHKAFTVTESADFGFIPLLWQPQDRQGCLEKQNYSLSSNLVVWCAKIGPKT